MDFDKISFKIGDEGHYEKMMVMSLYHDILKNDGLKVVTDGMRVIDFGELPSLTEIEETSNSMDLIDRVIIGTARKVMAHNMIERRDNRVLYKQLVSKVEFDFGDRRLVLTYT